MAKLICRAILIILFLLVLAVVIRVLSKLIYLGNPFTLHAPYVALAILYLVATCFLAKICTIGSRKKFLIILIIVAIFPRLLWIYLNDNKQVSDFAIYHELAISLVEGRGYAYSGDAGLEDIKVYLNINPELPYKTAWRAPGTSLIASLIYFFTVPSVLTFKFFNLLIGSLIPLLIYSLCQKIYSEKTARRSSLLWCLYPTNICVTSLVGSENLFTLLFLLALTAVQSSLCSQKHSFKWLVLSGISAGICSLVRPMWIFIGLSFIIFTYCNSGSFKFAAKKSIVFIFFMLITIFPWTVRNYSLFNKPVLICNAQGFFLAWHSYQHIPKIETSDDWKNKWVDWRNTSGEVEISKKGYSMAYYNIREAIFSGPYTWYLMFKRSITSIFEFDDQVIRWSIKGSNISDKSILQLQTINWFFYIGLIVFALPGVFYQLNSSIHVIWIFYIYFILTLAAHVIAPGITRYHFSLMPLFAIWSGCFLGRMFDKTRAVP